jgi:hypothetical protein
MAAKRREKTEGETTEAEAPPIARIYLTSPVSIPGQRKTEAVTVARVGAGIRCERVEPEMLGPIAGFALHFSSGEVRFVPATSVALVELG